MHDAFLTAPMNTQMINTISRKVTAASTHEAHRRAPGSPSATGASTLVPVEKESAAGSVAERPTAYKTKSYDVRNMTPREMAAMSSELYEGGSISFKDHALLSFQPEMGNGDLVDPSAADTPKDFVAYWERQLDAHSKVGARSLAQDDRKILNILQNLASLR